MRQHGTRAKYTAERCRCRRCRKAASDYERNRMRRNAYGRCDLVDATAARRRVRALVADGMGHKRVAAVAGVPVSTMSALLYGTAPSRRIRRATEAKILAVAAPDLAPGAAVAATGTRRRLQALVACGWSQAKLARWLGIQPANLSTTVRSADAVRTSTAAAVAELYERLWDQPPPERTHRDKIAASRARRYARQHGWVPPMCWDDDTIDDAQAVPEGVPCTVDGCGGDATSDGLCTLHHHRSRQGATHCPQGHPYLITHRNGRRHTVCRTCANEQRRKRRQEEAAA